MLGSWSKVW